MLIEVVNWSKYNPRTDVNHSSWFRLENTFWFDPAISRLDNDGKMVWVMLLATASKQGSGVFDLDCVLVASILKISEEKLQTVIADLELHEKIEKPTSRKRNVRVTPASRKRHADVHNVRDETRRTKRTKEDTQDLHPGPPPSDFDLTLAEEWLAYAKSKSPHLKAKPTKYADAIRRLQSSVGLSEAQVRETFDWLKTHEFWAKNALSPEGLFSRGKSGLRKIDTIRAQMAESVEASPDDYWAAVTREMEKVDAERRV